MSVERARKALRGEATDCIPLFDMPIHAGYVKHMSGMDPAVEPRKAMVETLRKLDMDMGMGWVPPTLADGSEELSEEDRAAWRNKSSTEADIFAYDPFAREDIAGMSPEDSRKQAWREYNDDMEQYGDIALPVGRTFTTLIHYAAEDLDWEEFLMAALEEEEEVDAMIERWLECSKKNISAWMDTPVEVMITHDDLAMTKGMVMSPDWLRKHIFNRYPALFQIIKDAGRYHLFMSDGDYSSVVEDLLEIGVDGFFIDPPCVDLEWLASVAGKDKIYYTGPAPALFTNGTPADMKAAVKDIADYARENLPRFFFHSTGAIMAPNVPVENIVAYFDACREYGRRS